MAREIVPCCNLDGKGPGCCRYCTTSTWASWKAYVAWGEAEHPICSYKTCGTLLQHIYVYVPHNLGTRDCVPISRLHSTSAQSRDHVAPVQSRDSAISVALLQLRRHLQCWACILKPPHQKLLGSSPTRRNSLPLGLGTGAERSQNCGVPLFKASPSLKVLNSLLLVSSDALTPLAHYVHKLRKCIAQSQDWLRNLEIGTQFRDSENAQCNLEIAQIPRLRGTYIHTQRNFWVKAHAF